METAVAEEQQLLQQEDGTFLLQQPDGTYVALTEDEINQLVEQGVLQVQDADEQLPDSTTVADKGGLISEADNQYNLSMNQQPIISSSGIVQSDHQHHGNSLSAHHARQVAISSQVDDHQEEILPINMDKVQRIQNQLPVQDAAAPLGSSKNPIRIIQQGSQYIVTQQLNDDQMKQIMQVLQNQQLIAEAQTGPQSTVYNPETNTRIIFRMTQNNKGGSSTRGGYTSHHSDGSQRKSVAGAGFGNMGTPSSYYSGPVARRGRPPLKRRVVEPQDPDFDPRSPDKAGKLTSSGRVVRPPRHMIKDYKTISMDNLGDDLREEDSDGGFSDFKVSDEENAPGGALSNNGEGGHKVSGGVDSQTIWECDRCTAQFATRIGLNRHIAVKHEAHTIPRGNADNALLVPLKRRNALKNALAEASDDEVVDICLPRLAKLVTPFDYLLVKSEKCEPVPVPNLSMVTEDLLNLLDISRAFLQEHLVPAPDQKGSEVGVHQAGETSPNSTIVNVDSESKAVALGIPCGIYNIKSYINEGYLPSRHRNVQNQSGGTPPPPSKQKVEIQNVSDSGQNIVNRAVNRKGSANHSQDISVVKFDNQAVHLAVPTTKKDSPANAVGVEQAAQQFNKPLVSDADIESGRFVQVLDEEGQPSELVIEANSGQLLNRFTGEQITMLEEGQMDTNNEEEEAANSELNKEDVESKATTLTTAESHLTADVHHSVTQVEANTLETAHVTMDPNCEEGASAVTTDKSVINVEPSMAMEEEEETIDISALFPGVTIQDVDSETILITKPDGSSLQVEHGGNGITLETLQALMQMEC